MPCEIDQFGLFLTWVMDLSFLYLFVDFYMNKYKYTGAMKSADKAKKID